MQRCHYVVKQGICLLQQSPEMNPSPREAAITTHYTFFSDAAAINSARVDVHV